MRTLSAGLHGTNNATPCIHNTLPQRNDVVKHLVGALSRGGNGRGLLENLCDNGKIGLKMTTNGASDITEALKNGRLELVGQCSALGER